MTPIETFDVDLPHGITLSCRAAGRADAPVIVLLHGFPEGAFIWDRTMAALADRYRLVAPNLRGYERSSRPTEVAAYHPKQLVADVAALLERLGAPVELLVAHDWGGALAWNLAAQAPQLLKRLMMINSPHPQTFLRGLQHDPAQQAASAYMSFLVRPDAEALLEANDHARLWSFFERMGATEPARPGGGWLTDTMREQYRAVWRGGLTGMLNYYRASPLKPPTDADRSVLALALPPRFGRIELPVRIVWGEADSALPPSLLDGIEQWVPQVDIVRVPGATHWIVHERPELIVDQISAATASR